MSTLYLYAQFTANKEGVSDLDDVTIDVDRIEKETGSVTALVTDATVTSVGSLSPLRNGIYRYAIADIDVLKYDYLGTFKTGSDDVDLKHVPSLRHEYVDTIADIDFATTTDTDNISNQIDGLETLTPEEHDWLSDLHQKIFIDWPDAPILPIPAPPAPETSVIYVYTRTEAGLINNVSVSCKLMEPAPVVRFDGYEATYEATKMSGEYDHEFDDREKGLIRFVCYPGLKYRFESRAAKLEKTVIAPPANTTANLADL